MTYDFVSVFQEDGYVFGGYNIEVTKILLILSFVMLSSAVYFVVRKRRRIVVRAKIEPNLPKLKKKDYTLEELKLFNGLRLDGRILVAVNGKVFDVSSDKKMYGPNGIYSAFAGCDATRGLATFSVKGNKETYDDLSDLGSMEMDKVAEWETQFKEKYEFVGNLLKPGQEPSSYSEDEDEEPRCQQQGISLKEE